MYLTKIFGLFFTHTRTAMSRMSILCFFQFIDEPLGYYTVLRTNVAQVLSPNAISFLGVLVALVSAK